MGKKVVLVYPEIPVTYWSFKHTLKFTEHKALMPPLGLLTVAALLPADYDIKLVDMNVRPLTADDISGADLVMISAMIVQRESFEKVVSLCRENRIPVAAGGPYPTSSYSEIEGVDYFILNEGELTLPEFIRDFEKGNPRPLYSDETKPDLSFAPVPRYDLINFGDYSCMAVQASRGCPYNCEFCDIIEMFGRKPRYKPAANFLLELDRIRALGHKGPVFIVDDNFIGNRKLVRELVGAILEWQERNNYPFSFFSETSIDLAQDEVLLDLMVKAGFNMVFIGIETPDTATLEQTQKKQNLKKDLLESVMAIQAKGIEVTAGFIVGFDTDPENIFDLQIDFIEKAGIALSMIGVMMVLPKTQLWRRLEKEGRLTGKTHGNNTHELDLNFIPVMDRDTLIQGYLRVIREIYRPGNYFKRSLTLVKRTPRRHFISRPIEKGDFKILWKSLYRQTFSGYGIYYILFLLKTIFYNRKNFPMAVNLAVKGHHFFKITQDILEKNSTDIPHKKKRRRPEGHVLSGRAAESL